MGWSGWDSRTEVKVLREGWSGDGYRKCARESAGGGGAQRQGSTGAVQRRVRGCRWVPKASAEEGMEARNGL